MLLTLIGIAPFLALYFWGALWFVARQRAELVVRTRQQFPQLYAGYSDVYIYTRSLEASEIPIKAVAWPLFDMLSLLERMVVVRTRTYLAELTERELKKHPHIVQLRIQQLETELDLADQVPPDAGSAAQS